MRGTVLFLPMLLAAVLAAGDAPTVFVFDETIAGRPSPSVDQAAVEAIAQYHRERLARARAELPAASPSMARIIRSDMGGMDAELERLAVVTGKTLRIGRRIITMSGGRIVVETPAEGTRVEVDPATGSGQSVSSPGSEPSVVQMAPPPAKLPLERGAAGPEILGRATLRFELSAEGRSYVAFIDPALPNPLAWLVPREGEDTAISLELAKLPGMPLELSHDSGDFVRRFTCVEMR